MPLGPAGTPVPAAQLAKAALRRLALAKLEPTPENYARAYDEELGVAPRAVLPARALALMQRMTASVVRDEAARETFAQAFACGRWPQVEQLLDVATTDEALRGEALAHLIDRLLGGVDRGSRQWTRARRKEGVQRVLAGSKADAQRLQHRLSQLVASWDGDTDEVAVPSDVLIEAAPVASPLPCAAVDTGHRRADGSAWPSVVAMLAGAVTCALPLKEPGSMALVRRLDGAVARVLGVEGATPELIGALARDCDEARRLFRQRHQLLDEMGALCHELTEGLTELAEDDSWASGQCAAMRARLAEDSSPRGVRSAGELLRSTRERQRQLRAERTRLATR